ncbi:SAM-dependent methyltransferase [Bifidobacterium sp. 82T24]|uniref:class I SAM-dependent methyltransferase n=1 Tax=Bifidobacterium pluvialisilvae TaxID=2834436 RepID=UPI001C5659C4|nr:class I SAM-dependent methyltransferase [Bifidobacterium pluvialisilvae]MBW3088624.1 SAM-dependent methyltransferase [Bifidobacterium pluvialisilvae]
MEISPGTREFIRTHRDDDVRDLALHAKAGDDVDMTTALEQIDGWQRATTKLPEWAAHDGIVYPPHISMEQCSSQTTALYKTAVAQRLMAGHGESMAGHSDTTLIDLTGGFGVDFSYMARAFTRGIYVERQARLCEVAEHNMAILGLDNVTIVNADAEDFLRRPDDTTDGMATTNPSSTMIVIDPARRDAHGARTYAIADCTPDVLALEDELLERATTVMVKLSPMLDWRKTVRDLGGPATVREVHIVSTGNECKELLVVLRRRAANATDDATGRYLLMTCVNDSQVVQYHIDESLEILADDDNADDGGNTVVDSRNAVGDVDAPNDDVDTSDDTERGNRYVYEPNASVMKAGCFALLERRYGVRQIGPNSHLFVADRPAQDFPGRGFVVDAVTGMGKRELKGALGGITHANIGTRNFPMNVAALRRKLKLKDGGDTYIFATTDATGRHMLLITRKTTGEPGNREPERDMA